MATPRAAEHRDLEQRFRNLEAAVRKIATVLGKRPQFEVSSGDLTISGGDLIVDGGDFLLLDTDGSTVFRLGPQTWGDRGVTLYREEGTTALSVSKLFENSTFQQVRILDRNGEEIVGEEALGSGLARPWLPIPLQPVTATATIVNTGPWGFEVTSSATAWTTTHQAWYARHNQFGTFRVRVAASDTTTAAEVRVIDVDSGAQLGGFLAGGWTGVRAAGTTGYTELVTPDGGLFLSGEPWENISLAVQVRRTAGAGSLRVAVPDARGGSADNS